jgi:hypothetical protein
MRAGIFLAVVCLSFGAAVALFVPVSLEQRLGNLFFFGLIPAVGFYAGGHILSRLLVLVSKVSGMIVARGSRCAALLANDPTLGRHGCLERVSKIPRHTS